MITWQVKPAQCWVIGGTQSQLLSQHWPSTGRYSHRLLGTPQTSLSHSSWSRYWRGSSSSRPVLLLLRSPPIRMSGSCRPPPEPAGLGRARSLLLWPLSGLGDTSPSDRQAPQWHSRRHMAGRDCLSVCVGMSMMAAAGTYTWLPAAVAACCLPAWPRCYVAGIAASLLLLHRSLCTASVCVCSQSNTKQSPACPAQYALCT